MRRPRLFVDVLNNNNIQHAINRVKQTFRACVCLLYMLNIFIILSLFILKRTLKILEWAYPSTGENEGKSGSVKPDRLL